MYTYNKFYKLPEDAKFIREEVFVKEQGFQDEFDSIDKEAIHVVFYDGERPVATCRCFKGKEKGEYIAGRIAVIKEYRGKHIGNDIMLAIDELVRLEGGTKISLSAQVRVKNFYKKNGYNEVGDIYFDEHCEHVHMEKSL